MISRPSPPHAALFAVLFVALTANAGDAASVLMVADEASAASPAGRAFLSGLRDAGRAPSQVSAASWSEVFVFAPDAARDAEFVRQATANATGRSLFFESRFDEAVEMLSAGLVALEADPSVLAFHPDLAPAAFDAVMTLARARSAQGDEEGARDVLERAAMIMWAARPSESEFPPRFIDAYDAVRAVVPTREVALRWSGGSGCTFRVDGFDMRGAETATSGEHILRLPAGDHFVQLECDAGVSLVHLLDARSAALEVDLVFDDALIVVGDRVVLRPRDDDPEAIRRLAAHAARLLGDGEVYTFADIAAAFGSDRAEITRWEAETRTFRAVRVVLDDGREQVRLADAIDYLQTGARAGTVVIWAETTGWPGTQLRPRPRSVAAWTAGGIAAVAAVSAVVMEARGAESRSDVRTCADLAGADCDPSVLPALRSDARRTRAGANTAWIAAGVATAAAVTFRALAGTRSPTVDAGATVGPGSAHARIGVRW